MPRPMWNPEFETLTRKQLCELEAPLIADQVNYVYQQSRYYRDKYDKAGIRPADINSQLALAQLPFTEKSDISTMQQQGELLGSHQAADFDDIIRLTCTGGSSGEPTRLGWSRGDIDGYNEMGARALWAMGCRPHDLVINCFNYSLYAGGIMDHGSFEYLGAATLAFGIGNSERLLDMLCKLPRREQGYAIYMTPSYAVHLADIAARRGLDLTRLSVNKGYFSGESGMQVEGYRQKIERAWGMHAMDMYGLAEIGVQSGECEYRNGLHYSGTGLVSVELIDPDSAEVIPFENEASGELVFTTLRRTACPLIRMRSHDIVRVYTEPCACGRNSFRFHLLGRSDDMFVVKGVNVFPLGVQEALLTHCPLISAEFLLELKAAPPIDYAPRLCIEVADVVAVEQYPRLVASIKATIQKHSNFTPAIELVKHGSIASEHKTKRLYRSYLSGAAPALDILYRE